MWETIGAIKDEFCGVLNPSAFTSDSIEGWVIMIVGLILIRSFWEKSIKAAWWCIGMIFMAQVFYALSLTGFNDIIPLGKVFKYDVMTSLAQCFVGTKLCDIILWFDSVIIATMDGMWDKCGDAFRIFLDNVKPLPDPFPHADL